MCREKLERESDLIFPHQCHFSVVLSKPYLFFFLMKNRKSKKEPPRQEPKLLASRSQNPCYHVGWNPVGTTRYFIRQTVEDCDTLKFFYYCW